MRDIYCPICKANGKEKLLLKVSDDTEGILYPKCRGCRRVVAIRVRAMNEPDKTSKAHFFDRG